jgi:hypothetical protein
LALYNKKPPVILITAVKIIHIKQKYPIISRNEQVPERGDPIEAEKVNCG